MNGDVRYTNANMSLPNYYEQFQGLNGARPLAIAYTAGYAERQAGSDRRGLRHRLAVGEERQPRRPDQLLQRSSAGNRHEFTSGTTVTVPTTAGQETINYTGLTSCTRSNSTTTSCDRLQTDHFEGYGRPRDRRDAGRLLRPAVHDQQPHGELGRDAAQHLLAHLALSGSPDLRRPGNRGAQRSDSGQQHHLRRSDHSRKRRNLQRRSASQRATGTSTASVEAMYNDNAFTPMGFRQLRHYRVHTIYRPKSWATVSGAFNDLERHNNTNNNQHFPGNTAAYSGPLDHVDHSRAVSFGAELFPNDRYGLDLNYSYSDVYMADNICFQGAAAPCRAARRACRCNPSGTALSRRRRAGHGSNDHSLGQPRTSMDAPTQFGSVAFMYSPIKKSTPTSATASPPSTAAGSSPMPATSTARWYPRIRSPFLNSSWTIHAGFDLEGRIRLLRLRRGRSIRRAVVQHANPTPCGRLHRGAGCPCSSLAGDSRGHVTRARRFTGFTAPRNFHANNVTLGSALSSSDRRCRPAPDAGASRKEARLTTAP